MAQKKITDLTALPSADSTDVLEIVDVSANSNKKVTVDGLIATGSISTTKLADASVTPVKISPAAFGQISETIVATETDYATGATVVTLSNYAFKANVPYLIAASSAMTQVNGGTAIWQASVVCSGSVDTGRYQGGGSATQQSSIKLFGVKVFTSDTTANVTLTITRLTGDNTLRIGSPRVIVIPLISTKA